MAAVIIAVTWRWTGYNAIIILAGLQNIPPELYEVAEVDGAPRWRQHLLITLPLLKPVLLFALVLSIIGTMQLFAEPYLITRGGPGNATETLGTYLYRQGFTAMNFGYASAVAYSIALMAGAVLGRSRSASSGGSVDPAPAAASSSPCIALLVPLALIWLMPLWLMITYSTLPEAEFFQGTVPLLPSDLVRVTTGRRCRRRRRFVRPLLNSRSRPRPSSPIVSVVITSMAGYAFARFQFFGRDVLFMLVIATLTIPYFAVIIPQFILVARDLAALQHLDRDHRPAAVQLGGRLLHAAEFPGGAAGDVRRGARRWRR